MSEIQIETVSCPLHRSCRDGEHQATDSSRCRTCQGFALNDGLWERKENIPLLLCAEIYSQLSGFVGKMACLSHEKRIHFQMHAAWVYIMTNSKNTTLYVGVTSNIYVRVKEHKSSHYPGSFTARYKLFKLVYYEGFELITDAIAREKFLKGKSRQYKIDLINSLNPKWSDLENQTADL